MVHPAQRREGGPGLRVRAVAEELAQGALHAPEDGRSPADEQLDAVGVPGHVLEGGDQLVRQRAVLGPRQHRLRLLNTASPLHINTLVCIDGVILTYLRAARSREPKSGETGTGN